MLVFLIHLHLPLYPCLLLSYLTVQRITKNTLPSAPENLYLQNPLSNPACPLKIDLIIADLMTPHSNITLKISSTNCLLMSLNPCKHFCSRDCIYKCLFKRTIPLILSSTKFSINGCKFCNFITTSFDDFSKLSFSVISCNFCFNISPSSPNVFKKASENL